MPMEQVRRSEALSKRVFHARLREWYDNTADVQIGDTSVDERTPWLYVQDGGATYMLHTDTSRIAVERYLSAVDRYGEDLAWTVVPNQRGNLNGVAYGPTQDRIIPFYLYLVQAEGLKWNRAVSEALQRFATRHATRVIERQRFLGEELRSIVAATGSSGKTPAQTVSRVLQDLRNAGFLVFSGAGTYVLVNTPIDIESEDLPDDALDAAINLNKLRLGSVDTSDVQVSARVRRGQARLRKLTLQNYNFRCAVCDLSDERLLRASHIVRWADDPEARGNLANVICLCCFHDALFENGYLAFTDDLWPIRQSVAGSVVLEQVLAAVTEFKAPVSHPPLPAYLAAHRERCGLRGEPSLPK